MHRVVVVGGPGSGKSTLAREAAVALSAVHVELDSIWWQAGWVHLALRQRPNQQIRGQPIPQERGHQQPGPAYRQRVASIWVEILESNLHRALGLMEAAIRDCTDELWTAPMWEVPDPPPDREVRGPTGDLVTEQVSRRALVQLSATPWAVAWHALERFDFMLTGGLVPWEIWQGFHGRTGWTPPPARSVWDRPYGGLDITTLSEPWRRHELLHLTAYCKERVTETLKDLTDEKATTRIGRRREPYVARVIDKTGHVIEHGAQIRQFITAAGVAADGAD